MTKPNLKEIEWAISELENQETTENRYILLAALYVCRSVMMGREPAVQKIAGYSPSAVPAESLEEYGESEFLQTVAGKEPAEAWGVMDELMDTLRVVNSRAYESVIRKLERL